MSQVQLPTGRVAQTAQRDLTRALLRAADPGPVRPTKTVAAPSGFAAPMALMAFAAMAPEDGGTGPATETLPLVGGWSLTTDESGALIAQHDDGSRQVLAVRTVPAREDDNNG